MDRQNKQNVFLELTKADDLDYANGLYAAAGWSVYDGLIEAWFRQGVQMSIAGESISGCWNNHQRRGYKAHQTVMAAVAEMAEVA